MKIKMFSILDSKAGAYMQPWFGLADGQAIRQFGDGVDDKGNALSKHPEDYSLWRIGEFDDETGLLEALESPVFLVNGVQVRKEV